MKDWKNKWIKKIRMVKKQESAKTLFDNLYAIGYEDGYSDGTNEAEVMNENREPMYNEGMD